MAPSLCTQATPQATNPLRNSALAEAFKVLDNYDATTHFNGQSTISLDGDLATGKTYCLAHHLWTENGQRILMVMFIRYLDTFVRQNGDWRFAKRQLVIDWTDKRPLRPSITSNPPSTHTRGISSGLPTPASHPYHLRP